jgi:cell division protease FtsH
MGGRQAENLIYGKGGITTGAESDLKQAAETARSMVTKIGMGESLRDQVFVDREEGGFFAGVSKPYSEETAKKIDHEITRLMGEATKRAEIILKANRKHLDALAVELLKKETLDDKEVKKVLKDTKLPKEAKLY